MNEIFSRLNKVFREVFDDPKLTLSSETSAKDVEGWDSLTNINLIFAAQREFRIKFGLGEIQELNNVGEMVRLIEKKMAAIAVA
jgi:acyl carrier protein